MEIIKNHLNDKEYVKIPSKKDKIYLHHTAGSHRPDWTIHGWNSDKLGRVATAYVIGGRDLKDKDNKFDGKIYEAFEDKYYAYSLGISPNTMEKDVVGIEICNYGQLSKSNTDGKYYTYVNTVVPKEMVYELDFDFKGYRYFHKYTDKQLEATRKLILDIADRHNIDVKQGMYEILNSNQYSLNPNMSTLELQQWLNEHNFKDHNFKALTEDGIMGNSTLSAKNKAESNAFDYQLAAHLGQPGIWTHVNVRKQGKLDCHPQPELIQMLKSL